MGANAQTAVPVFTAGQVLTAQQQTEINTGVPVFATTVTRDAAFGGAGEKTLAEGQFAYIEATNTTQYYDGAAWLAVAGAKLAQVQQGTLSTSFTTSSSSYVSTGLTATITPTSASSTILVMYTGPMAAVSGLDIFSTVFRGTVAGTNLGNTNGFSFSYNPAGATMGAHVAGIILDSPATTSATTYTVGMKVSGAGSGVFVSNTGRASLTLIEVLP